MQEHIILGVDVGGTGIKGGLVDVREGRIVSERLRYLTPKPATPQAVTATFKELIREINYQGPIGAGFPAIVRRGTALSAANIDPGWINTSITELFGAASGCPIYPLNDADAAGIAAMSFGAGRGEEGTVIMITVGSGLGSAMFVDGELVPNTELGHVYLKGHTKVAEQYVSNLVRKNDDLSWQEFGKRFNEYLRHLNRLFSPDLFIVGGGGSKYFSEFQAELDVPARVKPAILLNHAGTIGAAYYACLRHYGKVDALA